MKDFSPALKVGILIILITFGYLFGVTFCTIPDTGKELAKTIVPFLLASVIGVLIGYYWGNSSKEKTSEPSPYVSEPQPQPIPESEKVVDIITPK